MSEYSSNPKKVDDIQVQNDSSTVLDLNNIIEPYENILLRYRNPTYHFKLYTLSATDFKKYQIYDTDESYNKIVIAESGVTGKYSIENVEMIHTSPGTQNTKNGTALRFNMDLVEHKGMYLIDELMALSFKLGFKKFADLPFILELSFLGYKDNQNEPVYVPGTTKRWRVNINKAPGTVDSSGTTYHLELTVKTYGVEQKSWRIGEQIEFIGSSDVKSCMSAFNDALNDLADAQYGYITTLFPNDIDKNSFYKIYVAPSIGNLAIEQDKTQDAAVDASKNGDGSRKFNFPAKDTIGNVIDKIMDCAVTKDDSTDKTTRQFVHVIPVQYYVGYDKFRSKDVYRYEIFVVPYTLADVQDIYDIRNTATASDMQEILSTIDPNQKINMKRYDYTWSGLNTEIMNLDLELNMQYNYAANRNIESLIQLMNQKGYKISQADVQNQILNDQNLPELYRINRELSNKENRTQEEEAEYMRTNEAVEFYRNSAISSEGESAQANSQFYASEYLEDIKDEFDLSTFNINGTDKNDIFLNIPIDYHNLPEISSGTDIGNANLSEILNRSIKSNYYNDSFLQRIDLNVYGDPYWLGYSEHDLINHLQYLVGTKEKSPLTQYVMNNINAEPYLLLNLEPPKEVNESGLTISGREHILSQNVYKVHVIKSSFSSGSFTQEISGTIVKRSINKKLDVEQRERYSSSSSGSMPENMNYNLTGIPRV